MVPLNTPIAQVQQQQQHETTTRTPHQLIDTDAECKSAAGTSGPGHSLATTADSSSSSNSNDGKSHASTTTNSSKMLTTDSDADTQALRCAALSIQTGVHCLCGEELCGFDCHFLQQEFRAFAAAELRHRRRRRKNKDKGGAVSEDAKDLHTSRKHRSNDSNDSNSDGSNSIRDDRNSANNSSDDDDDDDDDNEAVVDLERRFCQHFSSARSTMGFDDSTFDDMFTSFDGGASVVRMPSGGDGVAIDSDSMHLPARMAMRRSKSCGVHSSEFDQEQLVRRHNAYRLRIGYHDEALRERSEKNTQTLLQRAMSSDGDSTATILARKALRYRKVLERMEGVDVTDPSLDVSKCLGVHWQRVGSPEQ